MIFMPAAVRVRGGRGRTGLRLFVSVDMKAMNRNHGFCEPLLYLGVFMFCEYPIPYPYPLSREPVQKGGPDSSNEVMQADGTASR